MSRFAWPLIAVLTACASSSAPAVQSPNAALAAKPVTPVPAEPLELLVANPDAVAVVQVDALRASPLFPRLRPYIERSTCIASTDLDWLLQATKRAISASRSTPDGEQWLALLDGHFAPADATRVLAQAVARRGDAGAAAVAREQRGRFELSLQADLAASVLDERVLLLGAADWVRASVDAVEHPAAAFAVSPLWRELGPKVHCGERPVCAFALGRGAAAERLGRALGQLGSRDLAGAFAQADSAASLALPGGADVSMVVQLNAAEVAEAAAAQVKSWLWQASLLTRLAGLPDVLSSAQLRADGTLFLGDLSASADDLTAYEARATKLFEPAANSCKGAAVAAR